MLIDVTYGVTDKLAISFGVPWVAAQYSWADPASAELDRSDAQRDRRPGRIIRPFQDLRSTCGTTSRSAGAVLTPDSSAP